MRPAIIGPLGPTQLACLRSWRTHGWQPLFIQLGEHPAPSLLVRSLGGYLHLPAVFGADERGRAIAHFLEMHDATGLTCVSYNLMQWLQSIRALLPANLGLWVSSPKALTALLSKRLQMDVAREVGLSLLPGVMIEDGRLLRVALDCFPLVLRPDDDSKVRPQFKMALVKDQRELEAFLDTRTRVDGAIVGQRFVNGPNFIVHGARSLSGKHLHQAAFLVRRKSGGVSLTIEPAVLSGELAAACNAFVQHIDHVGVYHFEFILEPTSGKYYFLEINGRLGGTTGKVLACGYDEPGHLVEAFRDDGTTNQAYTPQLRQAVYTNKRHVAKALLESLRRRATIFDYPGNGSVWAAASLAWGLLRWHDELFRYRYFGSALAYVLHEDLPGRRLRQTSTRPSRDSDEGE